MGECGKTLINSLSADSTPVAPACNLVPCTVHTIRRISPVQTHWFVSVSRMCHKWFSFHLKGICHFILVTNSNLVRISLTFSDIWPVIHRIFYPFSFNPKFKNVSLALDRWKFTCLGLRHMANYSLKRFPLRPNIQYVCDRRLRTDDNRNKSSTVT